MPAIASDFYKEQNKTFQQKIATVKKNLGILAWVRLFSFISIIAPVIVFGWNGWIVIIFSMIFLFLFLFLVIKNNKLERKRKNYEILIKLTENELLALNDNFSHFDNGAEYLDPAHFNSYDLDLFGEGSIFQFLNRTSTRSGHQLLANWLRNPFLNKDEIVKKQNAIKELSESPEWMLHFRARGLAFNESKQLSNEIRKWSETRLELSGTSYIKWLLSVVPLLTVAAGIYAVSGGSYFWLVLLILFQGSMLFLYRKNITRFYDFFGRKTELLDKYMHLIRYIEKTTFKATFLNELLKKFHKPDTASHIFAQLQKYVNRFEYRQNFIVNILFNSIFMWDIRCMFHLWKWHNKNRKKLSTWIDVLATFDSLISLANLAYNHPGFNYPEIHEGGFTFNAIQAGHPLIPEGKRINNDFKINGWGKVMIVTGANMAGKSTFLRTVGVNMILGSLGAPVCAQKLVFRPVRIYTNMRTTDSLLKDESYFFAELKRIKEVLDRLKQGERIFVILDEMLKGTNSIDKLNGSKHLIRKLLELKAVAIIATHDLKISEMEDEFPQLVYNKCFEIKLEDNEMNFDYLLKDGATKTMNATFLMKQMGIL